MNNVAGLSFKNDICTICNQNRVLFLIKDKNDISLHICKSCLDNVFDNYLKNELDKVKGLETQINNLSIQHSKIQNEISRKKEELNNINKYLVKEMDQDEF